MDSTIKYGLAGVLVGFLLRGNVSIGSRISGPNKIGSYEGLSMDRNWELHEFLINQIGESEVLDNLSRGVNSLEFNSVLRDTAGDYGFDLDEEEIWDGTVNSPFRP